MKFKPTSGNVALRPILPSEARADEVRKRSGLYLPKPTNSGGSFEGIPSQGIIFALPDEYDGDLKIGDRVVFSEQAPKGFKFEGETLFVFKLEQIVARVEVTDD